jgi:hypothetical protein
MWPIRVNGLKRLDQRSFRFFRWWTVCCGTRVRAQKLLGWRRTCWPSAGRAFSRRLPSPYTLHPTPCPLHPTPFTQDPTPYTLHHAPCTLHPSPKTLHPALYTLHPTPYTPHPTHYTCSRQCVLRLTPLPRIQSSYPWSPFSPRRARPGPGPHSAPHGRRPTPGPSPPS